MSSVTRSSPVISISNCNPHGLHAVLAYCVGVSQPDNNAMWMVTGTDLSPILPVLAKVFDQALEGGGAKNINFQELAADLAQITFDYPFRYATACSI